MDGSSSSPPRSLRPRRGERKSFAFLFHNPDLDEDDPDAIGSTDEEGGTSAPRKRLPAIEEPASESDYDPGEQAADKGEPEEEDDASLSELAATDPDDANSPGEGGDDNDDDDGSDTEMHLPNSGGLSVSHNRSRLRVNSGPAKSQVPVFTSFNFTQKRPGNRLMAPNVSSNSGRNRPLTMHSFPGPTRRLSQKPSPFEKPIMQATNGLGETALATRFVKAWGCSIFPGPAWELIEDLGFYKEVQYSEDEAERTRPIVHDEVFISPHSLEILDRQRASSYLSFVTSSGPDDAPPQTLPLNCFLGPYGAQTMQNFQPFDVCKLSTVFPQNASIVFSVGGPVWGLDWCPVSEDALEARQFIQYLAVAPFPAVNYSPLIGSRVQRPNLACIHIWSYGPGMKEVVGDESTSSPSSKKKRSKPTTKMEMSTDLMDAEVRCEMVLCIESGPAHEIKWCPLPSHDPPAQKTSKSRVPKLGIVAGVFGDGTVSLYTIPDPSYLRRREKTPEGEQLFVHLKEPVIRIEPEDATCSCLDWANSEILAIGCSNGNVLIYDVSDPLLDPDKAKDLLPTHCINVAQVFIRSIAWNRTPPFDSLGKSQLDEDPTVFCTVSYDGSLMVTDIREKSSHVITRSRDVPYTIESGPFVGGIVTTEYASIAKDYSLQGDILGRGHNTAESKGSIWDLSTSDFHPHLALGSTDGSCMTTNMLKPARRGSAVPMLMHKIYQMDFNRITQEYAMLENFIPVEISEGKKRKKQKAAEQAKLVSDASKPYASLDAAGKHEARNRDGSGAWPTEIGVHRVAWNSGAGYGCTGLLASGMACGLVRIDHLPGAWYGGRIPYVNVQAIRGEEKVPRKRGRRPKGKGEAQEVDDDGEGEEDDDGDAAMDVDP